MEMFQKYSTKKLERLHDLAIHNKMWTLAWKIDVELVNRYGCLEGE